MGIDRLLNLNKVLVLHRVHRHNSFHRLCTHTLRHWMRRLRHWWLNPSHTLFSGLSIQDFPPLEFHRCPNMFFDLGNSDPLDTLRKTGLFLCLRMIYRHNTPHDRLQQPQHHSCNHTQSCRPDQLVHMLICVYIWHAYNHGQFRVGCYQVYMRRYFQMFQSPW